MRTCNFRICRQMATGYNRTLVFAARLSQSDDYFFSGYLDRYLCTSVHFQNAELRMGIFRSGPYSTFHTFIMRISMITSKRTL